MESSDDENIILILALEEEQKKKRKRKEWISRICESRQTEGEFYTLFHKLINDESKFRQYFRMTYEEYFKLLNLLKPEIIKNNTTFRRAVTPEERLAVCLRFLATGDSFRTIAFSYRLGEATVRNIVYDTCDIIWRKLEPEVMPVPSTEMWENIEKDFYNLWNFPNCIGAIDSKHVVTEAPANSGSLFLIIDVGAYGKNSDGGIFAKSRLGKSLLEDSLNIPPDKVLRGTNIVTPHVIVGDEAFPLSKHLMRPYPGTQLAEDVSKRIFKYRLSRARRISENAFGILTQRFRIYQRRIKMTPEYLGKVVLATCCLHNFLRHEFQHNETENDNAEHLQEFRRTGGNAEAAEAFAVREKFKEYLVSEGSVDWQDSIIQREK